MKYRVLGILVVFSMTYFVVLASRDSRLEDGGLGLNEMYFWEVPIFFVAWLGAFALWFKGMQLALRASGPKFCLALFVWPFGVYLAIKGEGS